MMELKVWVDGIQRVICGVTDDTTCQDVVIALAHAMGRTGRFTLIEKWREIERPLTPVECPLKVLYKWGEYASEVKLYLCQSDSDRQRQRERYKNTDRFTHNFSPPQIQTDGAIKRSLTFSGVHNSTLTSFQPDHNLTRIRRNHLGPYQNGLSPRSSTHSSNSSARSLPRLQTSSPLDHSYEKNFTQYNGQILSQLNPHNVARYQDKLAPDASSQNQIPFRNSHDFIASDSHYQKLNKVTAEEHSLNSPKHSRQASLNVDVEEYDLDRNFPDILRDSNKRERPSVHTEYRLDDDSEPQPEPEKSRLLRLVSIQKERLKVHESQISLIETEITSLEEKENEYEKELQEITNDLLHLEQRESENEPELSELDSVLWVDVLQNECVKEKDYQLQIQGIKEKVCKCEMQVADEKQKESDLQDMIEKETELALKVEQENKEQEEKLKEEISKLRKELDLKQDDINKTEKDLEVISKELAEMEKILGEKHSEADVLEDDLKKVNLENFIFHPSPTEVIKSSDTGEAVLKILEGRLSPRPVTPTAKTANSQQAFINALASKNPNGVWV